MKKVIFLGVMCLMALTMYAQKCVVLDFQLGTNVTSEETEAISYNFRTNFYPDNYNVLEIERVNGKIKELGYDKTGLGGGSGVKPPQKNVAQGYTDLGLPSGTIWKDSNATGFYTYDEAVSQFGNRLPTKAQWEELKAECQWSWTGSGYKVTGPNGNSIVLPAAGIRDCNGMGGVGSIGDYWSSTPDGSEKAGSLIFYPGGVYVGNSYRSYVRSVRLVQD